MRKLLLALSLLGAHVYGQAADSSPSPADFSQFKNPAEIFNHVQTELGKRGQAADPVAMAAKFTDASQAMASLIERFPDSPEVWQARAMKIQFALVAAQISRQPAPKTTVPDLEAILKAPNAPQEIKQTARIILIQYHAINGPVADFEKQVDTFEKDYPDQKLPGQIKLLLASQLQSTNPEKAKKIEAEVARDKDGQVAAQAAAQAKKNELLNHPLPIKFTAVDGREVDLTKMPGKVILVDFWATWCGPCMQGVPEVVEVFKKYHDKGFEIVGISLDKDKEKLLAVTKAEGMTWPQYFDGRGWQNEISTAYGIDSIPQMWLVNKKGNLVSLNARQDLEGQVQKLLAE